MKVKRSSDISQNIVSQLEVIGFKLKGKNGSFYFKLNSNEFLRLATHSNHVASRQKVTTFIYRTKLDLMDFLKNARVK